MRSQVAPRKSLSHMSATHIGVTLLLPAGVLDPRHQRPAALLPARRPQAPALPARPHSGTILAPHHTAGIFNYFSYLVPRYCRAACWSQDPWLPQPPHSLVVSKVKPVRKPPSRLGSLQEELLSGSQTSARTSPCSTPTTSSPAPSYTVVLLRLSVTPLLHSSYAPRLSLTLGGTLSVRTVLGERTAMKRRLRWLTREKKLRKKTAVRRNSFVSA